MQSNRITMEQVRQSLCEHTRVEPPPRVIARVWRDLRDVRAASHNPPIVERRRGFAPRTAEPGKAA